MRVWAMGGGRDYGSEKWVVGGLDPEVLGAQRRGREGGGRFHPSLQLSHSLVTSAPSLYAFATYSDACPTVQLISLSLVNQDGDSSNESTRYRLTF